MSIVVRPCVWTHQLVVVKRELWHAQMRRVIKISFSWMSLRIEQLPAGVTLLQDHMLSFIRGCVSCLPVRNALLWRATPLIFCAGGQRSVRYLPEVLCQRAINRLKGHPNPPPNPALRHSHRPPARYSQLGTPLRCCAW